MRSLLLVAVYSYIYPLFIASLLCYPCREKRTVSHIPRSWFVRGVGRYVTWVQWVSRSSYVAPEFKQNKRDGVKEEWNVRFTPRNVDS